MAENSKNGNINKDMGKIISVHDRRSGVSYLVITEHIIKEINPKVNQEYKDI